MATPLTIDLITLQGLKIYKNNNFLLNNVSTRYSSEFSRPSAKVGNSIRIRKYGSAIYRTTMTANPTSGLNESYVPLTVDLPIGADVSFSTTDLSLSLNSFGDQVLAPYINVLAAGSSQMVWNVMIGAQHSVNTNANNVFGDPAAASIDPTPRSLLMAGVLLDNASAPASSAGTRLAVLSPSANMALVDGMSGMFNNQAAISRQFLSGTMALANLGISGGYGIDQSVPAHTTGTCTSVVMATASVSGDTVLAVDAISGTINKGDHLLLSVNACNVVSYADTGIKMEVVVTANVTNGQTAIHFWPPLVGSVGGTIPSANVVAYPQIDDTITFVTAPSTTTHSNIVFEKSALQVAWCYLAVPSGAVNSSRARQDGVEIRAINAFDFTNDLNLTRFDVLMGVTLTRPDHCVVLQSLV